MSRSPAVFTISTSVVLITRCRLFEGNEGCRKSRNGESRKPLSSRKPKRNKRRTTYSCFVIGPQVGVTSGVMEARTAPVEGFQTERGLVVEGVSVSCGASTTSFPFRKLCGSSNASALRVGKVSTANETGIRLGVSVSTLRRALPLNPPPPASEELAHPETSAHDSEGLTYSFPLVAYSLDDDAPSGSGRCPSRRPVVGSILYRPLSKREALS